MEAILGRISGGVRRAALAATIFAALAAAAPRAEAQAWGRGAAVRFPLVPGNEWVLRSDAGQVRTIRVERAAGAYRLVSGLFGRDTWLAYSALRRSRIYAYNPDARRWVAALRWDTGPFPTPTNWSFDLSADPCDRFAGSWTLLYGIGTHVGFLSYPLEIDFTLRPDAGARCAADTTGLWLVDRIGPVALRDGTGTMFTLASATVGGLVYPAPDPKQAAAKLGAFLKPVLAQVNAEVGGTLSDIAAVRRALARAFGPRLARGFNRELGRATLGKFHLSADGQDVDGNLETGPVFQLRSLAGWAPFFYQPTVIDGFTGEVYQGFFWNGRLDLYGPLAPPQDARLRGGFFFPPDRQDLERTLRAGLR